MKKEKGRDRTRISIWSKLSITAMILLGVNNIVEGIVFMKNPTSINPSEFAGFMIFNGAIVIALGSLIFGTLKILQESNRYIKQSEEVINDLLKKVENQ